MKSRLNNMKMDEENGENGEIRTRIQNIQDNQQKMRRLMELFTIQHATNIQLFNNVFLTNSLYAQNSFQIKKSFSSQISTMPSRKNKSQNETNMKKFQSTSAYNISSLKKSRPKNKSDSQYQPHEQNQSILEECLNETKNIPKIYGKLIIGFIYKSQSYVKSVLCFLNIDEGQFMTFIGSIKLKLSTIAQLRSLWIQSQSNKYAKAIRIISSQCLRKHSLSYIYNSRIERQKRNAKYRNKILKALEKPSQFTQMKDF